MDYLFQSVNKRRNISEVVPLRVDFFIMAAIAMEMAKMLKKKMKNTKMNIAGYSPNRN
jgi:hypothetical protein